MSTDTSGAIRERNRSGSGRDHTRCADSPFDRRLPVPPWLLTWDAGQEFPWSAFFQERVVFYPGSGTDGQPVKFFGSRHVAHCFVYADYGVGQDELARTLQPDAHPFLGYSSVAQHSIWAEGAFPSGIMTSDDAWEHPRVWSYGHTVPFGMLAVLQRAPDLGESHGPYRLAVLFLGCEGVSVYDLLFCRALMRAPFALVLQDHGFGGNWTRFGAGGDLERRALAAGCVPDFLLVGENTTPWNGYVPVSGAPEEIGGTHRLSRRLFRRGVFESDAGVGEMGL